MQACKYRLSLFVVIMDKSHGHQFVNIEGLHMAVTVHRQLLKSFSSHIVFCRYGRVCHQAKIWQVTLNKIRSYIWVMYW